MCEYVHMECDGILHYGSSSITFNSFRFRSSSEKQSEKIDFDEFV